MPDVVFYDNAQHVRLLESLLQDFLLGEHLLLVGNQVPHCSIDTLAT